MTLIEWRADSVQAVAFVTPGALQPDALAIWNALYPGEGPEAFQRPSGAPNSLSTAAGPDGPAHAAITSQIGRIDLARRGRLAPSSNEPPTLADLDDAVHRAADQLKQLLSIVPVFRIALVASLSTNADVGYSSILSNVTQGVTFPANAIDCIYQINVRRTSAVEIGISINRLCTWSSGEQSLIMFSVGGPGLQATGGSPMTMKSVPIVNFNIDVNTATGPGAIISAEKSAMVDELASEVIRIAKHGAEALQ